MKFCVLFLEISCVSLMISTCAAQILQDKLDGAPVGAPAMRHADSADNMIDGSKRPDLIPDLTAYRLYLLTVGEVATATDGDKQRQRAHIAIVKLANNDAAVLLTIAKDFKKQ